MPARLAMDLMAAGEPTALAVLGMGVIESDGPDDDVRVADAYAELAADDDPASMVLEYYAHQIESHGWMAEPLSTVTALLTKPSEDLQDKVRLCGRVLRSQSIRGCEEWAHADLLGQVMNEMMQQASKRKGAAAQYSPLLNNVVGALADPEYVLRMGTFTDLWAGSGMRAIGVATAIRMLGGDTEKIAWTLLDADPMARTIIAINCRAFDLGPDIKILDGSSYKQALLAAIADGSASRLAPFVQAEALAAVPEEVWSLVRDARRA